MAEDNSREHDEHQRSRTVDHQAAEHDRGQYGEATPSAQTAYATNLIGDPRLNGRGNGSVKAAVMRQAQQTQGNRAVQRAIQRAAQEEPPAPASTTSTTASATPAAPAGNPIIAAMWNNSVQQPVTEATELLQGSPSKSKIVTANNKIMGAASAIRTAHDAIPAGPANDLTKSRMQTRINGLLIDVLALEPHAGVLEPMADIRSGLATDQAQLAELGQQVANTSPTPSPATTETRGGGV